MQDQEIGLSGECSKAFRAHPRRAYGEADLAPRASQIENLSAVASSIAVAEHAARSAGPRKPNAELIAANVATLTKAMTGDEPIDSDQIIEIQRVLLKDSAPRLTGNFRDKQVWLGGNRYSPMVQPTLLLATNRSRRRLTISSGLPIDKT